MTCLLEVVNLSNIFCRACMISASPSSAVFNIPSPSVGDSSNTLQAMTPLSTGAEGLPISTYCVSHTRPIRSCGYIFIYFMVGPDFKILAQPCDSGFLLPENLALMQKETSYTTSPVHMSCSPFSLPSPFWNVVGVITRCPLHHSALCLPHSALLRLRH